MSKQKAIIISIGNEMHGIPLGAKVTIVSDVPEYASIGGVYLVKYGWFFPYYNYVKKGSVKLL
jgi:hypothetical protein